MEVDVLKPDEIGHNLVDYDETTLYDEESYDILDSGVAPSTSETSQTVEHYEPDRYEQLSASWTRPTLVARRMKSKLFRSPTPEQQRPTYPAISDQEFLDETSRAVCSVRQTAAEEEAEEAEKYRQHFAKNVRLALRHAPLVPDCQPSTSKEQVVPPGQDGKRPLQRLTLQIGKKVLRFKVIDSSSGGTALKWRFLGESISAIAPVQQDASGRFRCGTCKLVFKGGEEFQKHNQTYHSAQKSFVCVICGTGFTNKASLTMHHRIHSETNYKSHECPICHKVFSRASNLQQHVRMHQSGRHHFCEMCGRCFKELEQMTEHQALCNSLMNGELVSLEKPLRYQCSYCDKLFHHKRDKFIHERIHTGEKPYQCGYCGRGFTQSQTLTIHIRSHTGERPFSCSYCTKQFKDSSSLRKHEFRYHLQVDFMDFDESPTKGIVAEYGGTAAIWK